MDACPPERPTSRRILLVLGLLTLIGIVAAFAWKKPRRTAPARSELAHQPHFERKPLGADSPFRNVKADVKYVGDQACAGCHSAQCRTFRQHPMGRSFAAWAGPPDLEAWDQKANNPFKALGLDFRADDRDGRLFHGESLADANGRPLYAVEEEVAFILGSGTQGRTYLVNRDGFLYQSPISWFTSKKIWDIAPGYQVHQQHFQRPITEACLFCHANRVQAIENTVNDYRGPIFDGYAIGCERCHGPGELHVADRRQGPPAHEVDDSIVNPRHLDPVLREGVCEQCHLQGAERILRRGRHWFDYRPGLALHEIMTVFVMAPSMAKDNKQISQVQQMYSSRCFQKSNGKMGCVTCHDPHRLPDAAERVAFYRGRCLECHASRGCSVPEEMRRATHPDDSCMACHMPHQSAGDIAHSALTDHRVLRDPAHPPAVGGELLPGAIPIIPFHSKSVAPSDPEIPRALGIAMMNRALDSPRSFQGQVAHRALPLLQAARLSWPEDVDALEAEASALWMLDRSEEALATMKTGLAVAPDHEKLLRDAAGLAMELGLDDEAWQLWERAVKVNPWNAVTRYRRGILLVRRREWSEAIRELQLAARLDPTKAEIRILLMASYLDSGDRARARVEYDKLLRWNPPQVEDLRRRFGDRIP